jgi:hypothetical protein
MTDTSIPAPQPDDALAQPAPQFTPRPRIYPSTRYPIVLLTTAAVLFVGLIINSVGLSGFPGNAPVEQVMNFLISFDLVGGTITLVACAVSASRTLRAKLPTAGALDVFALLGAIFGAVALFGWIGLGGADMIAAIAAGERLRYMDDTAGTVMFGIPWILAFVFGALGFRKNASLASFILAGVALVLAFAVLAASLTSAILYGLALTD